MYKDICISPKMPLWPFISELSPIFEKHKYFARKSNKYFSNRKQSGIYFYILLSGKNYNPLSASRNSGARSGRAA